MAQGPGLHQVQRLSLQQILAPQLQQSLHLLQVSALELEQLVHEELQQNPLLEEMSKDEAPRAEVEDGDAAAAAADAEKADKEFKEEFEVLNKLDEEWRDYFSQAGGFRGSAQDDEQRQHFFDSIVELESLQQHLLAQLGFIETTPEYRKVVELLIGSINDDGYLLTPLEEISISSGIPLDELQKALDLIHSFHPVGVGSRSLKECLLIQLDRLGKSESVEAVLVNQHLDDLGKRRFPEIARQMNLTVEQVQQMANFISTLEPKPGRMFSADQQHYVAADVVVQRMEDDNYAILLNNEQIPHLRISNTYKEMMADSSKLGDAKEYIRDKIRAGKFLIKSIHQRQQTISNIARVIVDRQRDFLDKGLSFLKPLTMAQVAEVVGVHETTVSRAVANKYMQTPQGLFEMRFFFTPGFETASGGALSNASVKDTISQLVEREDQLKPLSDQEIVAILKEKGIPIARRTVAKYRTELNILPSNLRKKF